MWRNERLDEQLLRSGILIACLALFLLVPMRIVAYGYLPIDDALRHSAFAVADRSWGEIMLLNPAVPPNIDGQAGWHGFLRAVREVTGWSATKLVDFSVVLAFLTFTLAGLVASGSPPAWLLACAVLSVVEPGMFSKLILGRPLFLTMTAVLVLNFLWTRKKPLPWRIEALAVFLVLAINISGHSSAWYLWAIAIPPLVVCRQWRSLAIFGGAWAGAIAAAGLVSGWENTIATPLIGLKLGLLQAKTLGTNLVSELQPSGGPWVGLLVPSVFLAVKVARGASLRAEILRVDFCFMVVAWTLGLHVGRFWVEWGLPALAVWMTRQLRDGLNLGMSGLPRPLESAGLFALATCVMYFAQTADVGGRYTNTLRNPMLWMPLSEFVGELPPDGGILYSTDMRVFYILFHRLPQANFRYSTAMEAGVMPPEDLKVLRGVQSTGRLVEYKPWFDKMTEKDRILIRQSTKPEWTGIEFHAFFDGWMGRKAAP